MTLIVTIKDMRALKYCAAGSRQFAARHGLDWSRFLREGLPASEFEKIPDAMAHRVVEQAKRREGIE